MSGFCATLQTISEEKFYHHCYELKQIHYANITIASNC